MQMMTNKQPEKCPNKAPKNAKMYVCHILI